MPLSPPTATSSSGAPLPRRVTSSRCGVGNDADLSFPPAFRRGPSGLYRRDRTRPPRRSWPSITHRPRGSLARTLGRASRTARGVAVRSRTHAWSAVLHPALHSPLQGSASARPVDRPVSKECSGTNAGLPMSTPSFARGSKSGETALKAGGSTQTPSIGVPSELSAGPAARILSSSRNATDGALRATRRWAGATGFDCGAGAVLLR